MDNCDWLVVTEIVKSDAPKMTAMSGPNFMINNDKIFKLRFDQDYNV